MINSTQAEVNISQWICCSSTPIVVRHTNDTHIERRFRFRQNLIPDRLHLPDHGLYIDEYPWVATPMVGLRRQATTATLQQVIPDVTHTFPNYYCPKPPDPKCIRWMDSFPNRMYKSWPRRWAVCCSAIQCWPPWVRWMCLPRKADCANTALHVWINFMDRQTKFHVVKRWEKVFSFKDCKFNH